MRTTFRGISLVTSLLIPAGLAVAQYTTAPEAPAPQALPDAPQGPSVSIAPASPERPAMDVAPSAVIRVAPAGVRGQTVSVLPAAPMPAVEAAPQAPAAVGVVVQPDEMAPSAGFAPAGTRGQGQSVLILRAPPQPASEAAPQAPAAVGVVVQPGEMAPGALYAPAGTRDQGPTIAMLPATDSAPGAPTPMGLPGYRTAGTTSTLGSVPRDTTAYRQFAQAMPQGSTWGAGQAGSESGPALGAYVSEMPAAMAAQLQLRGGVVVDQVEPNGPAQRAGIERYDLITRADNQTIHNGRQLQRLVSRHHAGDRIHIEIVRQGETHSMDVQLDGGQGAANGTQKFEFTPRGNFAFGGGAGNRGAGGGFGNSGAGGGFGGAIEIPLPDMRQLEQMRQEFQNAMNQQQRAFQTMQDQLRRQADQMRRQADQMRQQLDRMRDQVRQEMQAYREQIRSNAANQAGSRDAFRSDQRKNWDTSPKSQGQPKDQDDSDNDNDQGQPLHK